MGKLLSDAQLDAIRKVALLGMQTEVTILHRNANLGLETSDGPYGSDVSWAETPDSETVMGLVRELGNPPVIIDGGQLVTSMTFELCLPIGTNIDHGDRVIFNNQTFVVTDVSPENTWLAYLPVNLRIVG